MVVLVESLSDGSCLGCSWNFFSYKARSRLLPHHWSLFDSQHCKHCWFHQMPHRC
uniref:Golgi apparatus membrane protein TVP23 n=1 Tax=Rhizophora mucronata TaxID=61149 RepID=A0A2P2JT60_RHIMU